MASARKIVDEVSGWLRVYDDGSVDRTWTGPPEVKFMSDPVPPHDDFIDGVAVRDVSVSQDSGLRVRIYLPEMEGHDDATKLPILLHFHGGGFCISRADWFMYYSPYTRLARTARAICVSVYLRLAPEHRLPAAADDGMNALLWLASLARAETQDPWLSRVGDFTRVFLIGDSSGGNLVHLVAARAGERATELGPLRLAGGVPVHPGFVRSERSRSEVEMAESPFLTLEMVDKFLGLALPEGATKDHPYTCPMGEEISKKKMPPMLVCVAEEDLVRDTNMEYYEALKKANKEVELFTSPGMGHSFYLNKIAVDMDPDTALQTDRLLARIANFVTTH